MTQCERVRINTLKYDTVTGNETHLLLNPTWSKSRQRPEIANLSCRWKQQKPYYNHDSAVSKVRPPANCAQPSFLPSSSPSCVGLFLVPRRVTETNTAVASRGFRLRSVAVAARTSASVSAVSYLATRLLGGGRSSGSSSGPRDALPVSFYVFSAIRPLFGGQTCELVGQLRNRGAVRFAAWFRRILALNACEVGRLHPARGDEAEVRGWMRSAGRGSSGRMTLWVSVNAVVLWVSFFRLYGVEIGLGFMKRHCALTHPTSPRRGSEKFLLKTAKTASFLVGRMTSCARNVSAQLVCSAELVSASATCEIAMGEEMSLRM